MRKYMRLEEDMKNDPFLRGLVGICDTVIYLRDPDDDDDDEEEDDDDI